MSDLEKIQDLQLQGIAKDIYRAELNFNIYLKIKKIWGELNEVETNQQKLFVYLKECAVEKTVLHLSKLYDNQSNRNPTRCIEAVIANIEKNPEWMKSHGLIERQWRDFVVSNQKTIQILSKFGDVSMKTFISSLKSYLTYQKSGDFELAKMKKWRDKMIAHNEKTELQPSLSDEEVQDFIAISKSLFDYLNCFIQTDVVVIMSVHNDTYFIDKLIEQTFRMQS